MKKCIRCGKELEDNETICDCGFNFDIYKEEQKYVIKEEEDPELTKNEKTKYIDNPIVTFILGIISLMLPITILGTRSVLFMIASFAVCILTMVLAEKPSLVKLKILQKVGKYLSYVGLALSLFFTVMVFMQLIIK